MTNLIDKPPFVSIIVPTYHDWDRLQICLNSLEKQTYPRALFEVIVVNNDPKDIMPKKITLRENFKVIGEEKPGSYAARNKGIYEAKGAILGFTDSDCIPDKDWITNAVSNLDEHTRRIGGKVKLYYKKANPTLVEIYDTLYSLRQKKYVDDLGAAATANMWTYKEVFKEVGDFNNSLFSGGDMEWGMRANSLGIPISYVENAIINHPARSTIRSLIIKEKRVSGGLMHLNDMFEDSLSKILFSFLKGFAPPLKEWVYISKQSWLSNGDKIKVFFLKYFMRLVERLEKLKVRVGKKMERQ